PAHIVLNGAFELFAVRDNAVSSVFVEFNSKRISYVIVKRRLRNLHYVLSVLFKNHRALSVLNFKRKRRIYRKNRTVFCVYGKCFVVDRLYIGRKFVHAL